MIRLGPDVCGDLDAALRREWLETNGIGGFASSTVAGLNTRRYHGLLVAATRPPLGRAVLLSKLEETLIVDGRRFDLSANRYPGAIHPHGYQLLKEFRLDPFPVFTYEAGGVTLEKSVFMVHGENATVVEYRLNGGPAQLEVRPLIAFRDYHHLTHRNEALNAAVQIEPGLATVKPYDGLPALHFAHDAAAVRPSAGWYFNFEYDRERERGLEFSEDLFSPFVLDYSGGGCLIASTEPTDARSARALRTAEMGRRERAAAASPVGDDFVRTLVAAAGQFIVSRGAGNTVIAGYPWFSDWGRDTMIALPGLALALGRVDVARSILLEFARHVDRGMLPNRFPDAGEVPEYNTVDATLWFFEAIRALLESTQDYGFVLEHLYPVLADVVAWHERGTRYGIRVDRDGLLLAGEPGSQLTWMDAKIGDWVVTPRHGKPVEIQALWYNALRVIEHLAWEFGDEAAGKRYSAMASAAERSFEPLFWNESAGCLYDVVNSGTRDASIRPNQIFAVSLPHSMLCPERARQVVNVVERELLTPYGLRSLAPRDPQYRGRYQGDPWSRDSAYHQGTVWPWLMGPFLTAYLKVHGRTPQARQEAQRLLSPLREHLLGEGLGQLPEVFDGDAPHRPGGCLAQAWSVAELLRALVEDVFDLAPAARLRRRAAVQIARAAEAARA